MNNKNEIIDHRLQMAGESLSNDNSREAEKRKGFSLMEVVVGMALVGIGLLGLAQLFFYSVMSNTRADKMTNATFLAQQQIDFLRNLPATDLSSLASSPIDEQMDINSDGIIDFRRITQIQPSGFYWTVRVLVFPAAQVGVDINELIQNPGHNQFRADISTIISR